ncbi:MAG: hypothetical protein GX129_01590 [Clostridiales bacterium]|nr:hypothetical protein [Clostridiales bacterium]
MDSEYRKPFEYEEEKRGLILLFIVMILAIDILQTLSFASQENKYLGHIRILSIGFYIMAAIFIVYIIYTTVIVFNMKGKFVLAAKRYIIIRTIFSLFNFLLIFYNVLQHENLIGEAQDQYQSVGSMLLWELFIPLIYIISFSLVWYLYFTYSKRCRNIEVTKNV